MLVSINPQVGGVSTDSKTRFFNFMASLHSVATCAAGATPTAVNPVNTSAVKNTGFNCISVLSNTEAGGWTAGTSNNITASTTYNASFTSPYIVDLYQASGKASFPYLRQTFGNFSYPFNSSFESYPQLQYYQGHTTVNPASSAYNADGNFTNGSYASIRPTSSWTSYANYFPINVVDTTQIYVAVTSTYLIIVTPSDIAYYGIRDQAGWELTRSDNPAWCTFGYNCQQIPAWGINNYYHVDYIWAYMAGIYPDGSQASPSKRGSERSYSQSQHTLHLGSNWMNSSTGMKNLFPISSSTYQGEGVSWWQPEAPITDPVTGLTVPPAYPIIYSWSSGTAAASGQVPGIYKGMTTTNAGLTQFASASEYVIAGTSYVPVRTGSTSYSDLFLLRKA
jgi:hypothetical protein